MTRVRLWLAIAALALGLGAALLRTPVPPSRPAAATPIYRPPGGC